MSFRENCAPMQSAVRAAIRQRGGSETSAIEGGQAVFYMARAMDHFAAGDTKEALLDLKLAGSFADDASLAFFGPQPVAVAEPA